MMGRLHFMGTPIFPAKSQGELTVKQQVFLDFATVEYVNDERDFQVQLHGGKSNRHSAANSNVQEAGQRKLVKPAPL